MNDRYDRRLMIERLNNNDEEQTEVELNIRSPDLETIEAMRGNTVVREARILCLGPPPGGRSGIRKPVYYHQPCSQ